MTRSRGEVGDPIHCDGCPRSSRNGKREEGDLERVSGGFGAMAGVIGTDIGLDVVGEIGKMKITGDGLGCSTLATVT